MATITAKAAGGKWGSTTTWEPEQVPTGSDDVILASTSGSVEVAAEASCRSLEGSAYKKTLTITSATLNIGAATSNGGLALNFGKTMTLTLSSAAIKFVSTAAEVQTITTGGRVMPRALFKAPGGKWQLQDKYEAGGGRLELEEGELNTNGQQCKLEAGFRSTGVGVRSLSLGTSTILLTGTGAVWEILTTGLTLSIMSATIEVTNTTTTLKTFGGGGASYPMVTFSGNYIEVQGVNTFATLNVNTARKAATVKGTLVALSSTLTVTEGTLPAVGEELKGTAIPNGTIVLKIVNEVGKTVEMSAAATETVTVAEPVEVFPAGLLFKQGETQTVGAFTTNGKAGELARLASSLSGKPATITKATGQVSVNFMILKDSKAAGITEWYAGTGSRNATGDSVWKFEEAPPFFTGTAAIRAGLGLSASGAKQASSSAMLRAALAVAPQGSKQGAGVTALPVGSGLRATGSKGLSGTVQQATAAHASASGLKQTLGLGEPRAASPITGSAAKGASGSASARIAAGAAPTGEKQAAASAILRAALRLLGGGQKGGLGEGAPRAGVHALAVGVSKRVVGEARPRAGVALLAESTEIDRSGRSALPTASRSVTMGTKATQGRGTVSAAPRAVSAASKGVAGGAVVRGAVRLLALGGKGVEGASVLRAAGHLFASGSKTPAGETQVRAGTTTAASGVKGALATGQLHVASDLAATGTKSTISSATVSSGVQSLVEVTKTVVGEAVLRIAARWMGLTRPKATTLTVITRSPTTLASESRSPTTLKGRSV